MWAAPECQEWECRQSRTRYCSHRGVHAARLAPFFPWVAASVPTHDWLRVGCINAGACGCAAASNGSEGNELSAGRRPKTAPTPQTLPACRASFWEPVQLEEGGGCEAVLPPGRPGIQHRPRTGVRRDAAAVFSAVRERGWGCRLGAAVGRPTRGAASPWGTAMARRWLREEAEEA